MSAQIYAGHAPQYSAAGFWPRPIQIGTKACKIPKWVTKDSEFPQGKRQQWLTKYGSEGIGLLLGSPLPDGTLLGALDVDHDDYVRVASVLLGGSPPCGRFGSKGIAYFVRISGEGRYRQFKYKSEGSSKPIVVAELLCVKRICVIPPTIHPDTNNPYRWIGKSLLDTHYTELPEIEV